MANDACSRISNFSDRASGMPVSWNPTVTLLQKKREGGLNSSACTEQDSNDLDVEASGSIVVEASGEPAQHLTNRKMDEKTPRNDLDDKRLTTEHENNLDANGKDENVGNSNEVDEKDVRQPGKGSSPLDETKNGREDEPVERKKSENDDGNKSSWSPPDASYRLKRYQNQPMKIENYEPGMSSIVLQDPFVNNLYNPPVEKPGEFCKYVENDPEVKYRIRKSNGAVSPSFSENSVHDLYRKVQKGGDIPLEGLRCPIPPVRAHSSRLKERAKLDGQLTINQGSNVGADSSTLRSESDWNSLLKNDRSIAASTASSCAYVQNRRTKDELTAARKRELDVAIAEARRKRLIEEAENNRARRHSDYFQPHAKSPVALDRYDLDDTHFRSGSSLPTSPLPYERHHIKARVLYTFAAQTNRELSLKKGDTVYILRQVDKNWYEGQRHGTVGIFPVNYVEVLEVSSEQSFGDRSHLVVAKFDFTAEYPVELSFRKGDILKLIRVIDSNWYEAFLGNQSGLVPKIYVEPLNSRLSVPLTVPVATSFGESPQHDSPGTMSSASSCLSSQLDPPLLASSGYLQCPELNTSLSTSGSNPSNPSHLERDHAAHGSLSSEHRQAPPVGHSRGRSNSLGASYNQSRAKQPKSDVFYHRPENSEDELDFRELRFVGHHSAVAPEFADAYFYAPESRYGTQTHYDGKDVLPYTVCQATFAYVPQDEDELELLTGDIIYVTEMFDDGWYVGISQRTNTYGTFPGNHVQRLRLRHLELCTL